MSLLERIKDLLSDHEAAMLRKARAIPVVRIADAKPGALVRIEGRVVDADDAFAAPFSGRRVAWARVLMSERHQDEEPTLGDALSGWSPLRGLRWQAGEQVWRVAVDETLGSTLRLDDGSGILARVPLENARVLVQPTSMRDAESLNHPRPELEAFLRRRGVDPTLGMGSDADKSSYEACLAPGDVVCVVGMVVAPPGAEDAYRSEGGGYVELGPSDGDLGLFVAPADRMHG